VDRMSNPDGRSRLIDILRYRQRFEERLEVIESEAPFDELYGVDTARSVELWDLPDGNELLLGRNARYSVSPTRTVRNVLANCEVDFESTAFVDMGSGKGRVVLIASEYAFRRVIGVEASEHLCQIARTNAEIYRRSGADTAPIEIVNADATKFDIPADASFFYFYEPFSTDVCSEVLARIEDSITSFPRPVTLCFTGMGQPDGEEVERASVPVAAAAAENRPQWIRQDVIKSPDASFYDAFVYRNVLS
jgi:SAM-dependent methyltransferase